MIRRNASQPTEHVSALVLSPAWLAGAAGGAGCQPRPAPPSALPERPPRERMIRAAEYLIRTKGVAATGVREVVQRAEAP
jgi:AcrR family transcriptional regulator